MFHHHRPALKKTKRLKEKSGCQNRMRKRHCDQFFPVISSSVSHSNPRIPLRHSREACFNLTSASSLACKVCSKGMGDAASRLNRVCTFAHKLLLQGYSEHNQHPVAAIYAQFGRKDILSTHSYFECCKGTPHLVGREGLRGIVGFRHKLFQQSLP